MSARSTCAPPERDLWADEAATVGPAPRDLGRPRRRGLAPARGRAIGRGRARLVARRARRPRRRLAGARRPTTSRSRSRPAAGPRTTTTTAATSIATTSAAARPGRRCRPRRSSRAWSRPGRACWRRRGSCRSRRSAATRRGAGSTSCCTATTSITSRSSSRGPTACASARSMATRSSPTRARPTMPASARRRPRSRRSSTRSSGPSRADAGPPRSVTPGLDAARPRRPPGGLGDGRRPGHRGVPRHRHLAGRSRGGHRRLERAARRRDPRTRARRPSSLATTTARAALLAAVETLADRGPALAGRLELGVRLPARPRPQAPRDARAVVRRGRLAGGLMPTDRTPGAATGAAGLTIEGIVAVESPREFRIHPRERTVAYTAEVAGARQLFTLSLRGTGAPRDAADRVGEADRRSAVVARRPAAGVRPGRRDLDRRGRRVAAHEGRRPSRAAGVTRNGRPTAGGSRSCRAGAAGPRSG